MLFSIPLSLLLANLTLASELTCGLRTRTVHLPPDSAQTAIDHYCSQNLYLDPAVRQNKFTQQPFPGVSYENFYVDEEYMIELRATYVLDQPGCANPKKISTRGMDCSQALREIVEGCGRDGGGKIIRRTQNGCIAWSLYGVPLM